MMYSRIPEDVVTYIMEFVFDYCDKCTNLTHISNIHFNYTEVEYRTIFDDDYYDPPIRVYRVICSSCISEIDKMYR